MEQDLVQHLQLVLKLRQVSQLAFLLSIDQKLLQQQLKNLQQKKILYRLDIYFHLVAKKGGVLIRAGHTEASVDIAKISSNSSGAVICEIMNDDGTMAKRDQLFKFAKKHRLQIAKIEDLIEYRLKKENFIKLQIKLNLNLKIKFSIKKIL